jgi:hypothetical protein
MNYELYEHHENMVYVRSDLKGKHRDYCLCFNCTKLDIEGLKKNCTIANALYKLCVKYSLTTPVFECPAFNQKNFDKPEVKKTLWQKIWQKIKNIFGKLQ